MSLQGFSAIAVIPAHLASVRFPEKILFEINGLPMIEHVRRRALLSSNLDRVVVATCDAEIASVIRNFGGDVIMTSDSHKNGTTRVAEAVEHLTCSHVILLQGDEPLLLPRHIDSLVDSMRLHADNVAWNATGCLSSQDELDRHSFVKCAVSPKGQIMFLFRRSPCFTAFDNQRAYIRKILGIIAYRKDFLSTLASSDPTPIEQNEFIEQLRILEYGHSILSVPVDPSLPSVNEPHEVETVLDYLHTNEEQKRLLQQILALD